MYPGTHRQNQTEMFTDHEKSLPIAAVSLSAAPCGSVGQLRQDRQIDTRLAAMDVVSVIITVNSISTLHFSTRITQYINKLQI